MGRTKVDFFFDPMCPWAYQTSKWIREIPEADVRWRFFSLEEINRQDGKKHPWEREWSYGWSLMRVGAWARRRDPELLDRWYATIGAALHERGEQPHVREEAERFAREAGLPPGAVDEAIADPTTTDEVKADHDEAVNRHSAFGVPTLVFPNGHALFGPVVTPAPAGEAAQRLWDLVTGWVEFPNLYELRKPKTPDDQAHITASFTPYLTGRSWQTIQKPVA
jgi:2-hydroxychromene-2-carboxylate isomerase